MASKTPEHIQRVLDALKHLKVVAKMTNLERKVKILEGALGINLDTSGTCSGDPLNCPADPCEPERCPMRNNLVQRMFRSYTALQRKADITEQVVEELCDAGVVTANMLTRAKLRVEMDGIIPEMYTVDMALKESEGQEEVVKILEAKKDSLTKRLHDLHSRIEELD